jgi:hypothetical protein
VADEDKIFARIAEGVDRHPGVFGGAGIRIFIWEVDRQDLVPPTV